MTDGLKDAHREAVIAVIAANDRVERAVLFGSRATGTNTVTSDVDIALFGDRLTLTHRARLTAALEEIPMAQTVDLLLYDSIQDRALREHIRNEGVEWFDRPRSGHSDRAMLSAASEADARQSSLCLDNVASITMGQSPSGETVSLRDGVPLLNGPTEFGAYHPHPVQFTTDPRRCAQPGDLLFCVRGSTTGRMNWADQRYAIGRGVAAIRHRENVRLQPFVRAVIEYQLPELLAYATGSTFPNVSGRQLAWTPYPNFTTERQRAIAHILGTLDDKIELNRRMNETLEAMARALFKSWFVDFDPVRAKMKGRDTGLPQDIADLFPDRLVDSEMGEIPEGWEVKSLKDCMNLTMGQSPPGSTYNDHGDGLPFFQGRSEFGFRYPQKRRFCSAPTRVADPEDTLVSVRAPVGDINLAWERCCIGRGVAALRHKSGSSSFTYHAAWALRRELKAYEHTGTVFGAINKGQFEALKVTEPDPCVVEAFDAMSASLDARIRSNVAESDTLAALRDTLLPKLISGEIRLGKTARTIGTTA